MLVIPANILLHIPDGFLHVLVSAACWLIALAVLALAVGRTRRDLDERLVPLAGIMAAFIFAAQMLNFPVAGGTSGHFVGAALAFIVLGPWLGLLAMTAVIAVQALLFQDGGLLVMGANILVMGVVPGFLGHKARHLFCAFTCSLCIGEEQPHASRQHIFNGAGHFVAHGVHHFRSGGRVVGMDPLSQR